MIKAKIISITLIATMLISMFAIFNLAQVNAKNYGYLNLKAASTNSHTYYTGEYTFKNIVFKVYKTNKKTIVKSIKAKNRKGETSSVKLPVGTYYVKETSIPTKSGYYTNTNFKKIVIKKTYTNKKPLKIKISHKYKTAAIRLVGGKQKKYYVVLEEAPWRPSAKPDKNGIFDFEKGSWEEIAFYCPLNTTKHVIAGWYLIYKKSNSKSEIINKTIKPGTTTTINLTNEE